MLDWDGKTQGLVGQQPQQTDGEVPEDAFVVAPEHVVPHLGERESPPVREPRCGGAGPIHSGTWTLSPSIAARFAAGLCSNGF